MESVWGALKTECVERNVFAAYQEAKIILFEDIEVCYHRQRLHSSLGYQGSADFEQIGVSSDSCPTP
jgi:transposase InsO family protein